MGKALRLYKDVFLHCLQVDALRAIRYTISDYCLESESCYEIF